MEHKDTPYSGKYGHYLKDCTLLLEEQRQFQVRMGSI